MGSLQPDARSFTKPFKRPQETAQHHDQTEKSAEETTNSLTHDGNAVKRGQITNEPYWSVCI